MDSGVDPVLLRGHHTFQLHTSVDVMVGAKFGQISCPGSTCTSQRILGVVAAATLAIFSLRAGSFSFFFCSSAFSTTGISICFKLDWVSSEEAREGRSAHGPVALLEFTKWLGAQELMPASNTC